ncbi:hypothetical protein NE865_03681 [Phthorimaea operculella]|nr:hypothetical protein NE865_03681 [Phthorimaea operculella]
MLVGERLFLVLVLLFSVIACERAIYPKRQKRHFLALLGYLHGYKIGQDYALQIPQYLITPIVIVPSVNQQQSVNIQQASNDENYQESGGSIQAITPVKIISADVTSTSKPDEENVTYSEIMNDDDDIEVPINKKPMKPSSNQAIADVTTDSEEQSTENNLNNKNETQVEQMMLMTTISTEATKNETKGPYPLPIYDNKIINSVLLTTEPISIENSQSLPPVTDDRWQNFTLRANLSGTMPDKSDNLTLINEKTNNTTPLPASSENKTENSNISKGPYPNAWYNNEAINQLSITTSYYTNEPSESYNGWGSYSPMNTLPSGFKPLAGLYYDGYLHTPVRKYGFVPKNYWK